MGPQAKQFLNEHYKVSHQRLIELIKSGAVPNGVAVFKFNTIPDDMCFVKATLEQNDYLRVGSRHAKKGQRFSEDYPYWIRKDHKTYDEIVKTVKL